MKRPSLRFLSTLLAALLLLMAGCSKGGTGSTGATSPSPDASAGNQTPITLNFPTFYAGVSPLTNVWKQTVSDFETANPNITIVNEEIPDATDFNNKIKTEAVADSLPDIVLYVGNNYLAQFQQAGLLCDLTPYLDSDPELKAECTDESLAANSIDGHVYALPRSTEIIGYFYNKDMFEKAGIAAPATTWPEFWADCDKLKAAGFIPLSMDATGWISTLMIGAIVGTSGEQGSTFMNTFNPTDYSLPEFVSAVRDVQTAFEKYTTSDAGTDDYGPAASYFLTEQTAMIFNGPWMLTDIENPDEANPGLIDRVGTAAFPGNGLYDEPSIGDMVTAKDKAHQDAAVAFLKYYHSADVMRQVLINGGDIPVNPQVAIDSEVQTAQPLAAALIDLSKNVQYKFSDYSILWYQNVQDALVTNYPLLASGQMTAEQFCQKLSDVAKTNSN